MTIENKFGHMLTDDSMWGQTHIHLSLFIDVSGVRWGCPLTPIDEF